jgi:hypothetical protein
MIERSLAAGARGFKILLLRKAQETALSLKGCCSAARARGNPRLDLCADLLQDLASRLVVVDDEAEVRLRLRRVALSERDDWSPRSMKAIPGSLSSTSISPKTARQKASARSRSSTSSAT